MASWWFFLFRFVFSFDESVSNQVSSVSGLSISISAFFVRQYRHAAYGSAESCCKFKVLSGVAKNFGMKGLGK
jgi:hypothetical protein